MMDTLTASRRRWILLGSVSVLLATLVFVFKDSLWFALQSMRGKTAQNTVSTGQPRPDMGAMADPSSADIKPSQVSAMVSPARQQWIGLNTAVVDLHPLQTTIRAVGRVEYDEQRITHVNLRMTGWVEDLFVDYTGQLVRKDQPLFTLYSQELVATQEEYLLALRAEADIQESPLLEAREQGRQMVEAARDRLRLWTITDKQIQELARRGTPQTYVTIYSPSTGFVVDKKVFKGMYVTPAMTAYTLANLSTVWVHAEVFEYEMPLIQVGQSGTLTLDAYPDQSFQGDITYIYPYLNPKTRTVKVRLVFPNPTFQLKPDMYGTVHLQVNRGRTLAVPEEAVLDSGTRKVVFVAQGEDMFEPRDVRLGPKVGSYYEVVSGLQQGERIVTSGTFLLDSESKLMASTNMMGTLGMGGIKMEQAQMGTMDMGAMDMDSMDKNMNMDMNGKHREEGKRSSAERSVHMNLSRTSDGLILSVSTEPPAPRVGDNLIRVQVGNENGLPVAKGRLQLRYTMPMPGMNPTTVPMIAQGDGRYEAHANLGMEGPWDLTIVIQRDGHPDIQERFSVTARAGEMPGMSGM
ncbi:MAG: FixH family protein [Nitrospira sp.]|nr:FixH family protein [Nitrospira sp.]